MSDGENLHDVIQKLGRRKRIGKETRSRGGCAASGSSGGGRTRGFTTEQRRGTRRRTARPHVRLAGRAIASWSGRVDAMTVERYPKLDQTELRGRWLQGPSSQLQRIAIEPTGSSPEWVRAALGTSILSMENLQQGDLDVVLSPFTCCIASPCTTPRVAVVGRVIEPPLGGALFSTNYARQGLFTECDQGLRPQFMFSRPHDGSASRSGRRKVTP
ncbi:hypothetical protein VTN00DRAFT_6824 [Thermoascus crustaceus]|uniref:uncharacterized protein n=1 Tax=Thermoascus crustaceus TaxID=5088 RepID=UPI003743C1C3